MLEKFLNPGYFQTNEKGRLDIISLLEKELFYKIETRGCEKEITALQLIYSQISIS